MAVVASKKSTMTLYSGENDIYSHRTRIVLAEKGVTAEIIEVLPNQKVEDLLDLNPYHSVPTLVDRNLVIYQSNIIMEYLDERFPHPPLLPVYPVARAKARLMMYRIEQDWYTLVEKIEHGKEKDSNNARKELTEGLLSVMPLFKEGPYFMSEDFSLIDCTLIPLLWRLPSWGIELPKQTAKPMEAYAKRMFARSSVTSSFTETERELRAGVVS